MKQLRNRLLEVSERLDGVAAPPRLADARTLLRRALRKAEATGISDQTSAAALMAEALPRIIACYGPAQTSRLLTDLAASIGSAAGQPTRQ